MNSISHKQAIQWIHRRLDGILNENERSILDEHLHSCDSCRAYADEMELVPSRLTHEFRSRWDPQPGPSQNAFRNVMDQASRIPMRNRIATVTQLFAGAAALIALAVAINFFVSRLQSTSPTANATEIVRNSQPPENRLLAFTSDQSGNLDIYTMRADGSGLTNITNNFATDAYPFWSPDGKQIAFMSDRDGSNQIYLMNANGSNVVQLTNGEGNYWFDVNGYTPWSPDGRKLIFFHKLPDEQAYKLYVMAIDGDNITTLTNEPDEYYLPSWSPDGNYVAFVTDTGRAPKNLFIVDSDGNHLTEVTKDLNPGEVFSFDYEWSPDDSSLFFPTNKNLYRYTADGIVAVITGDVDNQIIDWWNGGAIRVELGEERLNWIRSDGSQSTLALCEEIGSRFGIGPMLAIVDKQSKRGNLVFGMNCSTIGWKFYWANSDGTIIHPLLSSPLALGNASVSNLSWSADDRYLTFVSLDMDSPDFNETLYVLDIAKAQDDPSAQPLKMTSSFGASWQPIVDNVVLETGPAPEPTQTAVAEELPPIATDEENGEWIAYIGGAEFATEDVYLIHRDGGEPINLTNSPAAYFWADWSPDGKQLLFLRRGETVDILRKTEVNGIEVLIGTGMNPEAPLQYGWSPDSQQIAYTAILAGNVDIYTIYADGREDPHPTQLTNDPGQDFGFAWSRDGSQIAYQRKDDSRLSIMLMDADGANQREIGRGVGKVNLHWSLDGSAIYASGADGNWLECKGCVPKPAVYRIDLDSASVHQIYADDTGQVAGWYLYDTPQNVAYFMGVRLSTFIELRGTWFRANGDSIEEIGELDPHQTCQTATGNLWSENISPNERFSVISNYCGRFDLYLVDREASNSGQRFTHLLQLPPDTLGQGGDLSTIPMLWSPDGRWLIYDGGNSGMYLLDIERALQDPMTQPTLLFQFKNDFFSLFEMQWQPSP